MPVTIGGSGPITGVTSINTSVSDTELGYLDGVTSALQTQIDGKGTVTSGTYSPVMTGSTTAGTGTYTTQTGVYYKIGNLCQVQVYLAWSAHTGSGNMRISLPFTSANNGSYVVGVMNAPNMTVPAGGIPAFEMAPNDNKVLLTYFTTASGSLTALSFDSAATVFLSFSYITA